MGPVLQVPGLAGPKSVMATLLTAPKSEKVRMSRRFRCPLSDDSPDATRNYPASSIPWRVWAGVESSSATGFCGGFLCVRGTGSRPGTPLWPSLGQTPSFRKWMSESEIKINLMGNKWLKFGIHQEKSVLRLSL
jgi:hypothetical protein